MTIEAMKQALEALEAHADIGIKSDKAITALRTAIAAAEKQEPVGEVVQIDPGDEEDGPHAWVALYNDVALSTVLYTTPPAAPAQEPVAWMTINAYGEEDDISYENPEGRLPDGWTYLPLYTNPPKAKQPQEEPLGYWNAVQGWVELPEEAHKPTAWVYPEALEAFRQGKPWTAYGLNGEGFPGSDGVKRIPLYTHPPATPLQEPVAWMHKQTGVIVKEWTFNKDYFNPLYTHPPASPVQFKCTVVDDQHPNGVPLSQWGNTPTPPAAQRQWVGLTAKQIASIPINEHTLQTAEKLLKENNT